MIGFIGGGRMAEALIKGITSQAGKKMLVSDPLESRRSHLADSYNVDVFESNKDVVNASSIIILAVKPQQMSDVLDEIVDCVKSSTIIVSVAAGITIDFLEKKLRTKKIVRVMPNVPVFVQEGMTIVSVNQKNEDFDISPVLDIFTSVGKILILSEDKINAMATMSGCGPAFVAMLLDAWISAGNAMGLGNEDLNFILQQTILGTVKMLQSGISPQELCALVASPGGMTAAGLHAFEEKEIQKIVFDALQAARDRGIQLSA